MVSDLSLTIGAVIAPLTFIMIWFICSYQSLASGADEETSYISQGADEETSYISQGDTTNV